MRLRLRLLLPLMLCMLLFFPACGEGDVGLQSSRSERFLEQTEPLRATVEWAVLGLEALGVVAIVGGAVVATGWYGYDVIRDGPTRERTQRFRESLGQMILLGLEFLVAADIVNTVTISLTLRTVGSLSAIILIRTFLSFTLEVETTGYWPWQRRTFSQNRSQQNES